MFSIGSALAGSNGRWLHVRVDEGSQGGEKINVNIPLSLVQALIPAINTEEFHSGRVHFGADELEGVDIREVLNALRDAPDADYVTIDGGDESIRVSKERGFLIVNVDEDRGDRIRVRLPLNVVDALLGGDADELDLMAALDALADHGNGDLVTVESDDESVRIWIDSNDRGN
jgi:hypothetical protein